MLQIRDVIQNDRDKPVQNIVNDSDYNDTHLSP